MSHACKYITYHHHPLLGLLVSSKVYACDPTNKIIQATTSEPMSVQSVHCLILEKSATDDRLLYHTVARQRSAM